MEWLLFFCAVAKQIQRLFPVIFERTHEPKGSTKVELGAAKRKLLENSYWEIVAVKIAEMGVFNITGLTPLEAVMKKRAYDVIRVYSLKITEI